MSTPVWLMGASGLLAGEFCRLLEQHPRLHLAGAISREEGVELSELHPHLSRSVETISLANAAARIAECDEPGVLVLGLPHAQSAAAWKALRSELGEAAARELSVVDLSADYRLADRRAYARWYGQEHPDPDELAAFVYGLPEWHRERIAGSRRVAAPGCFATALQLATLPAARAELVSTGSPWVLNAITGSSGSGNVPKPGTHHPHRHGSLWAYGLGGHRHEAELEQALAPLGFQPELCFVPHSGPFVRGIHLTAILPLAGEVSTDEARAVYAAAYEGAPFVEVLAEGVPDLRRVAGSNRASLGVHVKGSSLVCLVTLDNVVKGGSGQALQCLNLMRGWPEETGLPIAGLGVL